MIPPTPFPLTRRLLASFSQWRNASLSSRARMPLSSGERTALEALDRNFHLAGAPERWIVDGRLDNGKLAVLLAGFTLTEEAVPDLVRATRLSGFQAGLLQRELTRWLKDGNFRAVTTALNRPESLANQTAQPEREALQAPAAGEVVALHSVPTERPLASPTGTKPAEVGDRLSTVAPPVLATQNASGLPVNQAHTDPFEPEGSLTQETETMAVVEAIPNEVVSNPIRDYISTMEQRETFADGRIGQMEGTAVREQVERLLRDLNIDIAQDISYATQADLAQRIGGTVSPRQVRRALEQIRADLGIQLRRGGLTPGATREGSVTARVEKLLLRSGVDLSQPFPKGTVEQMAAQLQATTSAVSTALGRIRQRTNQRTTRTGAPPPRAGEASVTDRALDVVAARGWDLFNLPLNATSEVAKELQVTASSASCALYRARKRAEKNPQAPAVNRMPAPSAELPAVESSTPAAAPTAPRAPAPVADDVRSLGLKLAGKLADLDDREALLKAVSIWEQVR